MSNQVDFPGNLRTNTYILSDFGEIAYIVCKYANPHNAGDITEEIKPDHVLSRLRKAEKQFRQASILVALDPEKLELFTFYKKVDVVRDQKAILGRFGLVCRVNACIIARKSAARVLELLKPESGRVYQLFTTAILSSIQIRPCGESAVIPIGLRNYLVPLLTEDPAGGTNQETRQWRLCRINLQVTATGHVVLILQGSKSSALERLSHGVAKAPLTPPTNVFLAPTGQCARYHGHLYGKFYDVEAKARTSEAYRVRLLQMSRVSDWCNDQNIPEVISRDATTWVEVEIPLLESEGAGQLTLTRSLMWKQIMWPVSLVYNFVVDEHPNEEVVGSAVDSDFLNFVDEWIATSEERTRAMRKEQDEINESQKTIDEDFLFDEEVLFHEQDSIRPFGPPVFPASQMVYPTPPDGALTHATPGMSSIDGIVATPSLANQNARISGDDGLDVDMQDPDEHLAVNHDTDVYDDDLFDDVMPIEGLERGTTADEPNWDFFDKPNLRENIKASEDNDGRGNLLQLEDSPEDDRSENAPETGLPSVRSAPNNGMNSVESAVSGDNSSDHDLERESRYREPKSALDVLDESRGNHEAIKSELQSDTRIDDFSEPTHATYVRRSSQLDKTASLTHQKPRDVRYQAQGKFYFDDVESVRWHKRGLRPTQPKSAPSSSDSTMSSDDSESVASVEDDGSSVPKRGWMEYNDDDTKPPPEGSPMLNDTVAIQEVTAILEIIARAKGNDPFLSDIGRPQTEGPYTFDDSQRASMVAQILVDQVSQSYLLRDSIRAQTPMRYQLPPINLSIDHNETQTSVDQTSLSELTNFALPVPASNKIQLLDDLQICVKRGDSKICANIPIIQFWDNLGIQPYHGGKDVVAFCLHPASTNIRSGATTFMSRLTDSYSGCQFGSHNMGSIGGLCPDGFLSWSPSAGAASSLKHVCQQLGAALAESLISDAILIYIVSPYTNPVSYRDICSSFAELFEAFARLSKDRNVVQDLALQIVPLPFVASPDAITVLPQDDFLHIAIESYNRIPPLADKDQLASCTSAIVLDDLAHIEPVFDLSSTATDPIAKEGSCLHLAYCFSRDGRWLAAAWTDEKGLTALTMSYCLRGNSDGASRSNREIIRDMWEVSHELMGMHRRRWRLAVARVGLYEFEELNYWLHLAGSSGEERKPQTRLLLFSVELEPNIVLQSPASSMRGTVPASTAQQPMPHAAATPVSTPQMSTTSPEQVNPAPPTPGGPSQVSAPTPPEHAVEPSNEADMVLIDPQEQIWRVTLGFGLNQSHSFLDIRPALASGFLVKHQGEGGAVASVGVNFVAPVRAGATAISIPEREAVLQEVLYQYRRLYALALTRGCVDKTTEIVPWHVATAVKGAKLLGEVM